MSQEQFLVFTAIPGGVTKAGLRVTVFVTPNLTGDPGATLAAFPPFRDWPAVIKAIGFSLYVRDANRKQLAKVMDPKLAPGPSPDSAAWVRLFTPQTPVGPSAMETCAATPVTPPAVYDVAEIRAIVRGEYARRAGSLKINKDAGDKAASKLAQARRSAIRRYSEAELEAAANKIDKSKDDVKALSVESRSTSAFQQFQAFHLPPPGAAMRSTVSNLSTTDKADSSEEFHALIAAACQHPHLLRVLGLAIDFDIPIDDIPLGDNELIMVPFGDPTLMRPITTRTVSPWTSFRHNTVNSPGGAVRVFFPLGNNGDADGLLDLNDPRFVVATEDLDNGAYGVLDSVEREEAAAKSSTPGAIDTRPTGLRTKGIQVFDTTTADQIAAAKVRAEKIAADARGASAPFPIGMNSIPVAPVLTRDDLMAGHRIDVQDVAGGTWRSLCKRRSRFTLTPGARPVEEEGYLVDSQSEANPASGSSERTSQILFRWNGWSLVTPRPGAATDEAGAPVRDAAGPHALSSEDTVVPGSLMPLRYGRSYRFRCREVDLSGGGWAPDDPALRIVGSKTARTVPFLRLEPVSPPRIGGVKTQSGKARLVIGSSKDLLNRDGAAELAAPIASLDMAEKHGAFDRMSPADSFALLKRTAAAKTGGDQAQIVDPAYGGVLAFQAWPPSPTPAIVSVKPEVLDVDTDVVDVRAAAGPSHSLKAGGGALRATVPPGSAMRLQVASFIPEPLRKQFDIHGGDADVGEPGYDLIAPHDELIIVHPTERPIRAPRFGARVDPEIAPVTVETRKLGDTHARFSDPGFTVAVESTGRFDVLGEWDEFSDTPSGETWPTRVRQQARLFGADVPLPAGHPLATMAQAEGREPVAFDPKKPDAPLKLLPESAHYDFRDTRHRVVTLTASAISRFEEFFRTRSANAPERFTVRSSPTTVSILNTRSPAAPRISHIAPTLARTPGKGGATITTEGWGLRVYMHPGDWFESGEGVRLAAVFSQPPRLGELSQIAGDPIVASAAVVNNLNPSDFVNARSEHANLRQLRSLPGAGQPPAPTDADFVSAATFDVDYDPTSGLLVADVVFRRRRAYRPFVRLALTRFQPASVDGAHLSTTVFADFLQLTPERTLSMIRANKKAQLRIFGAFPRVAKADLVKTQLVAIYQTERRERGQTIWDDATRAKFSLLQQSDDLEQAIWTCTLPLPSSSGQIIVEEWEVWSEPTANAPPAGRVVYSEVIKL